MLRKSIVACTAVLLLAVPAMAEITVSFAYPNGTQVLVGGTLEVEICAIVPPEEAVVAWGMDLAVGPEATFLPPPVIDPTWTPGSGDGDGLGGLELPDGGIFGNLTLATITVQGASVGWATLDLSDSNPLFFNGTFYEGTGDLTEGFALNPPPVGAFAPVDYCQGLIEVIPEPASLSLLALGGLLALRRRR